MVWHINRRSGHSQVKKGNTTDPEVDLSRQSLDKEDRELRIEKEPSNNRGLGKNNREITPRHQSLLLR